MMTVFTVEEVDEFEPTQGCVGIFSTYEKAKEFADNLSKETNYEDRYQVYEFKIDQDTK